MGTWTGAGRRAGGASGSDNAATAAPRDKIPGEDALSKMGAWTGFGGRKSPNDEENSADRDEEDDDRRIRFTIGGAGRRLTKDDFLKEILKLDPKARQKIVEGSDAPLDMKEMARKDASEDSPGSSRLFGSKDVHVTSGKGVAKQIGAKMAHDRGASVDSEDSRDNSPERGRPGSGHKRLQKIDSQPSEEEAGEETAAERKRRLQAFKGVQSGENSRANSTSRSTSVSGDEGLGAPVTAADRRRAAAMAEHLSSTSEPGSSSHETPAEKRRREAALGVSGAGADSDSEDDNTERVPRAKAAEPRRGIRFAQSPVRGKK
jgi:hypothetical protein